MIHQTVQERAQANERVHEGNGAGRLVVTVLKAAFKMVEGAAASIAVGFKIFADTMERVGPPRT
jgi:hypothetical protein